MGRFEIVTKAKVWSQGYRAKPKLRRLMVPINGNMWGSLGPWL